MLASFICGAQSISTAIGARAMAMGYSAACLSDEWSLFNNIGGLAGTEHTTVSFTHELHPSFAQFNRVAIVFAMPLGPGVCAGGISRFGSELYNEHVVSAGFSNKFGIASLGAKINYIQYNAEGFGGTGAFTVSFGGIANITERLAVGANITNITQPRLSRRNDERLPTSLNLGLALKLSDKLFLTTEVEKDIQYPLSWKSGMEYRFNKKFAARTGFSLYPQAGYGGVEFSLKELRFLYGAAVNPFMGLYHQATIARNFSKKR